MDKWADYFISEASYDSDHLISAALRHQDTDKGITKGEPIDRLTIYHKWIILHYNLQWKRVLEKGT
jgi:hypothetical protein